MPWPKAAPESCRPGHAAGGGAGAVVRQIGGGALGAGQDVGWPKGAADGQSARCDQWAAGGIAGAGHFTTGGPAA